MRRKNLIIVAAIILVILGCSFYYKNVTSKPIKLENVTVKVESGDSFYGILNNLNEQGALKNRMLLGIYVKLHRVSCNVIPGTFEIPGNSTIDEMIDILQNPENQGIKITIPEGYNIDKIAELFESKGLFSKEDFINAVKSYPVPSYIPESSERRYDLEGFLFPDTYTFTEDITPSGAVDQLVKNFESKTQMYMGEDNNLYELITKASIIEGETRLDDERSIVSSVINNRLKDNMMLQIDATVIYALGEHVDTVLYEHLDVDSPYNTYRNYGLPVGPICSPGIESIKAAAHPAATDYLYYVLQNENQHYFTNSYDDFESKKVELGY